MYPSVSPARKKPQQLIGSMRINTGINLYTMQQPYLDHELVDHSNTICSNIYKECDAFATLRNATGIRFALQSSSHGRNS